MLLAYIDEIGETGPFVSPTDSRFNTSPAFGYAGFIIPEEHARDFGAIFVKEKRTRFSKEVAKADDPAQWEAKGSSLFRKDTLEKRPENLRIFCGLVRKLNRYNGQLFYYADEKPIGTRKQTSFTSEVGIERERLAMKETLNRIARYAYQQDSNVLVMIDSVNEKERRERVSKGYQHIFERSANFPEMRSVLEPPMHIDSKLSSNIQFADWVAAYTSRAIDRQLIQDSRFKWVGEHPSYREIAGHFTYDSKLHLYHRSIADLNNSKIVHKERPLWDKVTETSVRNRFHASMVNKIHQAAVDHQSI